MALCRSVVLLLPMALLLLLMLLVTEYPCIVYARMHVSERRHLQTRAREMFYHGYRNYMTHAFPWDELKPLSCEGRRWDQRERGDLDDVLGGFSLTLVDSLDMLAIVGDRDEFKRAVQLVIDHVTFDRDVTVSVFESTIRVIGGLISAHLLASPQHAGILTAEEYSGELLTMAIDLCQRLLPAFNTPTGLPVHRVNLKHGVLKNSPTLTCPAAAGSLLVEMAYLSRLSGLPVFEEKARHAVMALWLRRSDLDLLGSAIDVASGQWIHSHGGIGAGLDSYFEYLLKYHLISGDHVWLDMFNMSYTAVETHVNHDDLHIEVDMNYGRRHIWSRRVSALQAFWPGLQVLAGDVSSAIRSHEKLFSLWDKFGAMPELFDLGGEGNVISWARTSPLRPELIESTYHLYQATRDDKYLKIGRKLLQDIERVSKVTCGYAAVGNIHTLTVEDRMDSYFLSETVKYLYLLFSEDPDVIVPALPHKSCGNMSISHKNHTNSSVVCTPSSSRVVKSTDIIFSTEGHLLLLNSNLFERPKATEVEASSHAAACENGNALVTKHDIEMATLRTQTVVQVGISIRWNDVHIMTIVASPAIFGLQINRQTQFEVPLRLFSKTTGEACSSLSKADQKDIKGKVVMVTRGTCSFAEKALRLQRAGAFGVIVINSKTSKAKHPARTYVMTDDGRGLGKEVVIPVLLISREDASQLHRHTVIREGLERNNAEGTSEETSLVVSLSPWLY